MRHHFALAAATLAALSISFPARADVRYDFTAESSYALNGETLTGSFSVIVPDFISVDTDIPVDSLLSCDVTVTKRGRTVASTCLSQLFRPAYYNGEDAIGFNVATKTNPNRAALYYFEVGAFGHYGSYDTVEFGADQFGTLVVSQVGAVPEPATWMSLFAGLGLVGGVARSKAMRRRD